MCQVLKHEMAPSATSNPLVVHVLPADVPACQGGNLRNSCTHFALVKLIQLLQEAGMDLPTDTSAVALGKPSEVMPDA